ncbi:Hsp20/alpha crystallin family protein [Ancylostoma ceylanicum]|uniref:Hsp20/alpha crystallin family protein n=1 Tax=Ancylostoma ceylanicum TaxID=53326 RepID=A0A0D6LZE5_9BILA|nr:Hsp20/alpha crystallin family protein [Ancylostoma ceylanicum]
MSLWRHRRPGPFDDFFDFDRFDREMFPFSTRRRCIEPYWMDADHSVLHVANQTQEVVNDNKKFAVALDVSQFKPEEISVHLQDRDLIIEGKQEHKDEKGYMQRSFVRKWTLPPDVDLDAVRTQLTDVGHLSVEAPKSGHGVKTREIPIMPAPRKN